MTILNAVKPIILLLTLACAAHADLLATFNTTQGNVVVQLQYGTAPKAVANLITLAQGTRPWIHPSSGSIHNGPFYNGLKIHRVVNDSSFKIVQGGSPKGDGTDGPGYTFKDEFSASLLHTPYVLSMANSGPNSNGSQFFFTGNVSISSLDYVHTVFGLVTDSASRAVVDAMLAAGSNNTTINSITITRTDPAAVAFDEQAQNLPIIFQPPGNLSVTPAVSAIWNFQSPITTGDVFQVFRSTTLASGSWSELSSSRHHVGITPPSAPPAVTNILLDNAINSRAFYNLTIARHPDSVAPSSVENRTVLLDLGGDLIQYEFNATGSAGLATVFPTSGSNYSFSFNTLDLSSTAHNITLIIDNVGLSNQTYRYFLIKIGCDTANTTQIDGRHTVQLYNGFSWYPFTSGLAAITR